MQYWDVHISTCFNKDTCELFILCIVPVNHLLALLVLFFCSRYSLLSFMYFVHCSILLFILLFNFILLWFFCFFVRCAFFERENFSSDPELCSGISIPLPVQVNLHTTPSIWVNKHHTADSTDFVLVLERRTYYDHRHSRIN